MQNRTPAVKPDGVTYTIRKDGKIIVSSSIPACGYSTDELKSLRAAGYDLYEGSKKVKITKATKS